MSKDDFDALPGQNKNRVKASKRPHDVDAREGPFTFDQAVDVNKEILNIRGIGSDFEVDDYVLEPIIANVAKLNRIPDRTERTIQQAAYLIAMITFRQPFFDGNKTTSLFLGTDLLRKNGWELPLNTKEQKGEIFDLLQDIMNSKKGYDDVEKLLRKRVVSLE